jgi:hypothetical protein
MSGGNRYVPTGAIRDAVKGHEATILAELGIDWTGKKKHIRCPYPDHPDENPSWRWDDAKGRAYCTCMKSASIFGVISKIRGIDFEAAKVEAAKLIGRADLIRTRGVKKNRKGGPGSNTSSDNAATPQRPGCTLAAYAEAKQLPVEFLRSLSMSDMSYWGAPAVRIPYFDKTGAEVTARFRVALEGANKLRWRKGSKALLYGLHRLDAARKSASMLLPFTSLQKIAIAARYIRRGSLREAKRVPPVIAKPARQALPARQARSAAAVVTGGETALGAVGLAARLGPANLAECRLGLRIGHPHDLHKVEALGRAGEEEVLAHGCQL